MAAPRVKRLNTIGIRYLEGERVDDDLPLILDVTLGINDEDFTGISNSGKDRVMVKLRNQMTYDELCLRFANETLDIEDGDRKLKVRVEDLSTYRTKVIVRNVPFELTDFMLRDILVDYGEVHRINQCTRQYGRYKGILNGERWVEMEVKRPIPSSLFIQCTRTYITLYHPKQIKTCRRCGHPDHFAKDCRKGVLKRVNVVNDKYFPPISQGGDEENVTDPGPPRVCEASANAEHGTQISVESVDMPEQREAPVSIGHDDLLSEEDTSVVDSLAIPENGPVSKASVESVSFSLGILSDYVSNGSPVANVEEEIESGISARMEIVEEVSAVVSGKKGKTNKRKMCCRHRSGD